MMLALDCHAEDVCRTLEKRQIVLNKFALRSAVDL